MQKSSYRQSEGGRFPATAAAGDHGERATGGGEALVEAGSETALFAGAVVDGLGAEFVVLCGIGRCGGVVGGGDVAEFVEESLPKAGVDVVGVVRWGGEPLAVIRGRSAVGRESEDEGAAAADEAVGGGSAVGAKSGVEIEDDGGEVGAQQFTVVVGVDEAVGGVVGRVGDPGDGGGWEGGDEVECASPRCTWRAGEGIQTPCVNYR